MPYSFICDIGGKSGFYHIYSAIIEPVNNFVLKDPTHAWSGGLDRQLKMHDLNTDQGKTNLIAS